MLLLRLWNYIRGYVIIVVEGYFLEKFINICIHRQIFLWDINRTKNCKMTLKISIKGFKSIRPIAKKTRCRVHLLKKRGVPFILSKYKKRKMFIVGAIAFIAMIYVLTSYIWAIDLDGNKKLDSQIIIDKLAVYGVRPGVLKYNINANKVANSMMMDLKELAWIGVSVKGTKVKVHVVERIKPPELINKNEPCNIVAYRDGLIKTVIAKGGQEMVKAGDTVAKGQILISGTITSENKDIKPRLVHAFGQVKARTWYEEKIPVQERVLEKERTGRKRDNFSIIFFSKEINLFHRKVTYNNFDKVEVKRKLSVGEDLVLPFGYVVDRYYEDKLTEKQISLDEAKKIAADKALKKIKEDIPADAEIVKTDVNYIEEDNGEITVDVIVECIEDIGVVDRIGGK